jgi:cytidylate kinase
VVFPNADVKFFLTASEQVRAERRYRELVAKGSDATLEETLKEMLERDERDSNRAVAPLTQAEDAILVDSTGQTLDEVVDRMVSAVRSREG